MIKSKGIFAVSFIAMMVVGGAYANIASQGYVDEKIDGLAAVAKTGAYGDLSGRPTIPTVNNATLTIQKNGATVDTFTANASANKTINITVPTQTSQLTNNSGFITADDLPDGYTLPVATANTLGGVKSGGDITVATSGAVTVNSATKADSATKATQDASGNVITTTYATKSELTNGLSGKQATLTSAQLNAVNSGITSAKVSTYDGYNAKITAAQNAADSKVATAQGSSAANKAVITNASGNITTGTISSGMIANDAVTSAKIATGAVGADALAANAVTSAKIADGTITNADIATNAAIAASKISGLSTVATTGSYDDLADKPTIPSAYVLKAATSSALGGVKSGGDITVATSGAVTVNSATQADSATKATQDGNGANIANTYAKKTELPTVNNATLTIQKNGETVNTFTANASANKTINITVPTQTSQLTNNSGFITADDLPEDYTLPVATTSVLGGVKSGGDITVSSTGAVTVNSATTADSAAKATADANGNNIANTYATKAQLTALDSTSDGTGAVVTSVSQTDGKVSVTKGNVQIPVGSATATTYATIWVQ